MKIYRICTEAKNTDAVKHLVDAYFACYDVKYGEGTWKGVGEPSMTIEIMTEGLNDRYIIDQIARQIKLCNQQQAVLIQELECEGRFI
jgi:hypothetical protein